MNKRGVQMAVLAVPVVLGIILFAVAIIQRGRFANDTDRRQKVEREIAISLQNIDKEKETGDDRIAVADQGVQEESTYLTFLRSSATATRVDIVRYTATDPTINTGSAPVDIKGATPIKGSLEAVGTYRDLLAFMTRLEKGQRLLALNDVSWNRTEDVDQVRLSAEITRFVVPVTTPPPNS